MDGPFYGALVGMTSFLLLDAVVVFGISIWGIASNSCAIQKAKACMYCCVESPPQTRPVIVYLPANQVNLNVCYVHHYVHKIYKERLNLHEWSGPVFKYLGITLGRPMHVTDISIQRIFCALAVSKQASQINATAGQVIPGGVAPMPQTFYAHGQNAFAGAAQASQINATAGQVVPGSVAPVPQTFYAHGQSALAGAAQETGKCKFCVVIRLSKQSPSHLVCRNHSVAGRTP